MQQRFGERRKIIKDGHPFERLGELIFSAFAFAGPNQSGQCADCLGAFEVTKRVAHHWHAIQRHIQSAADLLEQSRFGFSAGAVVIRSMRAEKYRINLAAVVAKRAGHFVVNLIECGHVIKATGDAGLVSGYDYGVIGARQSRNRFQGSRDGYPFCGRLDVVI